jgi:hypothetical protein
MGEMEENFIHTKYGYCYYEVEAGRAPIIFNLYVHPEYRRTGQARKLIAYVINQIRSLGYTGKIDIEALPREQSISREDLANFYEGLGLHVVDNSPVNELASEVERLKAYTDRLLSDESRVWMCTGCGFRFLRKVGAEDHVSLEDTSIPCPQCDKGRARPSAFFLEEENERLRGQISALLGAGDDLVDSCVDYETSLPARCDWHALVEKISAEEG